ncbi:hypothetical protein B0J13DRAFT_479092 [Dactylonectria estremocensis]|uniref:Zn(2)-C6 fungal-type domain-containing protein n=1 Tax=Dactylonectria estremocensis TaxID=1079267 RepID=A0A9P9IVV2_9HYPO|nr:hypothetical protein B0J13DRAFT_479092 [Dactylonectria estremocensis]
MLSTPADSDVSPTDAVTMQDGGTSLEEDLIPFREGRTEQNSSAAEKLACDRCRYRKIKCDRVHPCTNCIKTKSQCAYTLSQKVKEKRQRVLISSVYESKMEHISRKIDDLTEMMSLLSQAKYNGANLASPSGSHPSARHWPSSAPTRNPKTELHQQPMAGGETIETSLFSQAVFAIRFLQTAVANDPYSQVASEMTSVVDALENIVETQRQHNSAHQGSNPFEKPLPPGLSSRDLPLPPLEKVMACLRMAHGRYSGLGGLLRVANFFSEQPSINIQWVLELRSLGHFTEYVIKAYSPGPVTDAELIIIHMGLYWLFLECASILTDDTTKLDYAAQALVSKDNLETVLSNLSFHTPTTVDYVRAMCIATLYCLQRCKPVAAWAFISKASLLAQALGLHSKIPVSTDAPDDSQRKASLFWALYRLEKAVSLRLGRSSTIRDVEITVSRPNNEHRVLPWYTRVPNTIETAILYGRVYDEIYSPRALSQPINVRASHARQLSTELKGVMAENNKFFGVEPKLLNSFNFFKHADRVGGYSLLTSIYKSLPSGESSSCPECLSAARMTLQEHFICMTHVADEALHCPLVDLWVNGALFLSPFIPFNILFCNIVETSDAADLQQLLRVVEVLESTSKIPRYSTACSRQLGIFRTLYDVAAKYVEVKSKTETHGVMLSGDIGGIDIETYLSTNVCGQDSFASSTFAAPGPMAVEAREQIGDDPKQSLVPSDDDNPEDFGMEEILSGAELGDWFYRNHQMMRFLDDNPG